MGSLSIWHWMIVLLVVLLLFGSGKVSTLMGDFAKGIKSFKKHMAEDEGQDSSMAATAERPTGSIPGPGASSAAVRSAETTRVQS
ncbi:MAG: twin-arginine translocase TatA/TatE family subunit [Acetobacteraceae bacterium]